MPCILYNNVYKHFLCPRYYLLKCIKCRINFTLSHFGLNSEKNQLIGVKIPHEKESNKAICLFHYAVGLGSEKSRLSVATQGSGGPCCEPSVRCTHKDNENEQTGTFSFCIGPLAWTLLSDLLPAKNGRPFCIFVRCVPFSSARCVRLTLV